MTDKQTVREKVWSLLESEGVARFPGAKGRIPNFRGAEQAADALSTLPEWRAAAAIKANPDSPQQPVRFLALRDGKRVYMAVPRLRSEKCFVELDPARLAGDERAASSIRGAMRFGRHLHPSDMPHIGLVVAGSVAVRRDGARVGKGGGYSDIEFGLGRHFGLIDDSTTIVTTVHDLQIVEDEWPTIAHDLAVDYIVTPTETFATHSRYDRPQGICWDLLPEEKLAAIPILQTIRRHAP